MSRCRATSATKAFCNRLVAEDVRELGGLDILVNNAARQISHKDLAGISTQDFDDTFKTNVYAMFWITKAALPHLAPGAAIINTAAVNSYDRGKHIIDYAATKGAIMIFTKGLAKQLADKGIRVNAVAATLQAVPPGRAVCSVRTAASATRKRTTSSDRAS